MTGPGKFSNLTFTSEALFNADKIKKWLLGLQGVNDPRLLRAESDEIVAAVKRNGVAVKHLVFPDEGHGFAKRNQLLGYEATLEFEMSG